MDKSTILISACLLGHKVRYDGRDCLQDHPRLQAWIKTDKVIAFCPEVAGGLPTPRPPSEIQPPAFGKPLVMANTGEDVSAQFLLGAQKTLELAQKNNVRVAILKAKSPSCGNLKIYDGSFTKQLIDGMGITAALLSQQGILVFNEEQIDLALDAAG